MNELLSAKNISFFIGKRRILSNVSFTIHPHDFVFLTGNNGSGKTTFLNAIARYHPNAAASFVDGKILYNGNKNHINYDITTNKDSQWYLREIYYLKQESKIQLSILSMFRHTMEPLSIEKNANPTLNKKSNEIEKITREYIQSFFEEHEFLTERFEEDRSRKPFQKKFLDQPMDCLSGGQKKIVEILVALMRAKSQNIKLLLIDEPFNHLDIKNIKKTVELILEARKSNPDLAIIVTTHCMAFPTPCSGINGNYIEPDFFKHYIVTEGTIRLANKKEIYKQGKCFIDI